MPTKFLATFWTLLEDKNQTQTRLKQTAWERSSLFLINGVRYNRVFVNSRVRYNRVSLYDGTVWILNLRMGIFPQVYYNFKVLKTKIIFNSDEKKHFFKFLGPFMVKWEKLSVTFFVFLPLLACWHPPIEKLTFCCPYHPFNGHFLWTSKIWEKCAKNLFRPLHNKMFKICFCFNYFQIWFLFNCLCSHSNRYNNLIHRIISRNSVLK